MRRPEKSEYVDYYRTYVGCVPDEPVLDVLARAPAELESGLGSVRDEDETFAYADGKWTVRQVIGHVIDVERVFAYRALHIARSDPVGLPGMDQDVWMTGSNAHARPLSSQLAEFRALRAANVELFGSFDEEILGRSGLASGAPFTVRALVYIVAGHELHHRRVLEEKYLSVLLQGD